MWHLIFHVVVHTLVQMGREPVAPPPPKPRTRIDDLKSDIRHLKEILAKGSQMRKQTPAERDAEPTTFGYARFPLTEKEREAIERRLEIMEEMLGHASTKPQ